MRILIRPNYIHFDEERFQPLIEKLQYTVYRIGARYEDAPEYTDCVTAVRYILDYSTDIVLPRVYTGDMPKLLIGKGFRQVSLQDAKMGDLIFFEKMSERHQSYMIAHIGILISENEFFHSSIHFGGGKISSVDDIDYNSLILDESFLEIAKDPRNNI